MNHEQFKSNLKSVLRFYVLAVIILTLCLTPALLVGLILS